ncbi:hypothetical protein [Shinella sp. BYT-45]|uniref:hypothetical protein n=1 Tax=Shinella sp. BYT-45 TaxID=3377377 RepID=UPI003981805B
MKIKYCQPFDLVCYALSPEALGALTWVGFIATAIGLLIAISQIMSVKKSAEKATAAIERLSTHIDGVNLAYVSAQMNTITHLVQNQDYSLAQITFTPIKRTIRLHANSKGLDLDTLDALNRTIGKIDKQIEWGRVGHSKYSQVTANKLIDDLLSQLTLWESTASDKNRKEIQNENA